MSEWDWVQWYTVVFVAGEITLTMAWDGKPKQRTYWSAGDGALTAVFLLPLIGRIFGWW